MNDYNNLIINRIISKRLIIDRGYITPCWEFTGCINDSGYGKIYYRYKIWRVHRLFYRLYNLNSFNINLHVLHKCNNRKCFNLDHLYQGTQSDNMYYKVESGNCPKANKTHCIRGHEFTLDNTLLDKNGNRKCKRCNKDRLIIWRIQNTIS